MESLPDPDRDPDPDRGSGTRRNPASLDELVDRLLPGDTLRDVQDLLQATEPPGDEIRDWEPRGSAPTLPARYRFARALRSLRETRGISQIELGRRAGLTSGYVSKLESGRATSPSIHTMEKIANALQVPPGYLSERAGVLDEDLQEYVENNSAIVDFLNEARFANLPSRSWERLRSVLRDEIRANTAAISLRPGASGDPG